MSISLKWAEEADLDRVAETRLRCYAKTSGELEQYKKWIRAGRAKVGDFLLAERDGEAVGTATSLSFNMWVRGASIPCQGVAWVGTVRTARRNAGAGVAFQIMHETIRRGRERQQVVSALMPFRGSFYEHFGYGFVEKRIEWTVPTSILPQGDCTGMRYYESGDCDAVAACRQRQVEAGQGDLETSPEMWKERHDNFDEGFEVVDRPDRDGPAHGFLAMVDQPAPARRILRITDHGYDSPAALKRLLCFLGSQRDQYGSVIIQLPADVPLNFLLKETQLPHRNVEHPAATANVQWRMQVRVLDHIRFFEKLRLPANVKGSATIAVKETEGQISNLKLEISDGRASAKPSQATPDIECRDVEWAMIACGALPASIAGAHGLIKVNQNRALEPLEALCVGPAAFSGEYF